MCCDFARYAISMRIAYCANVRLPSERAHGHQIAQVCDALVYLGHEVTLFVPQRRNLIQEDYYSYYGAERDVKLQYLDAFDNNKFPVSLGLPGLYLANASLRRALYRALSGENFDLFYTRAPTLLPVLLKKGVPVVLELHQLPRFGRASFVRKCNACRLVSCLTSPMRDELVQMGVASEHVIVEPDAVNLQLFSQQTDRKAWHHEHDIPSDVPLISYVGQLRSMGLSKGVETLLSALEDLSRSGRDFCAVIAGGPDDVRHKMENGLSPNLRSKVKFLGTIDHRSVPALLSASDLLVYPAPASNHQFYMRDTSPLKIFEYMASGKPIVCADLPPLRDVLSEETAFLASPGDSTELALAMNHALEHPEEADKHAELARKIVENHTWEKRMQRILQVSAS